MKKGYMYTKLRHTIKDIKTINDLGIKGELSTILETSTEIQKLLIEAPEELDD
jgi:hypothetical protein